MSDTTQLPTETNVNKPCDCKEYGPLIDSLYPHSVYRCSACDLHHGTHTFNGAVNWQCPREWIAEPHHASADQEYVGCLCKRCNGFVPVAQEREIRHRNAQAQAARWRNAAR